MTGSRPPVPIRGAAAAPTKTRRVGRAAAVAAAAVFVLAATCRVALAPGDGQVEGVWMIEDEVALAVAPCGEGDALCGRIVWLRTPRDEAGRPKRDTMNPDAVLRDRPLCGVIPNPGDRLHSLRIPGRDGRA